MVDFKYERLVSMGYYCGILGHLDRACNKRDEDITNRSLKEGLYREWMRAQEIPLLSGYGHNINSPSTPIRSISPDPKPSSRTRDSAYIPSPINPDLSNPTPQTNTPTPPKLISESQLP
ncbi:formation of crista junctions protein 1 [Striga asiatica]|uniref:Formation of crista junctions protein 1 n=1 Tax=Striga asiatica TaxID=4170 RepID=A0A5A7R0S0_STRAF|nr:formation of crista junctions protein 1 [Striga asiatica]